MIPSKHRRRPESLNVPQTHQLFSAASVMKALPLVPGQRINLTD
jgi:hypothetical protein